MTNKRYGVVCLRIGLAASLATALFWGTWSLFAPVPDSGALKITESIVYNVPISRWYDILFALLIVNVYGWLLRGLRLATKKQVSDGDFYFNLAAGLAAGLAVGLVAGLVAGLVVLCRVLFSVGFWNKIGDWLIARSVS